MFENVTYDFYADTLGRSVVPDEAEFNKHALENKLYVKSLLEDGLVEEKEENGIDSAVCMMIEADYKAAQVESGNSSLDASESINGYSHSVDTKAYDTYIEKNAQSTESVKYKWLSLYCNIKNGVL